MSQLPPPLPPRPADLTPQRPRPPEPFLPPHLAGPLDDPAAAPPSEFLQRDHRCIQCSYNLRGLPRSGACPECGTPVADSLRGVLLEHASPDYRAILARGLGLVTNGTLLLIALSLVGGIAAAAISSLLQSSNPSGIKSLFQLIMIIPQALVMWGYWLYATPDPGYNGPDEPLRARKIIRFTTAAQAVTIGLTVLFTLIAESGLGGSGTTLTVNILTRIIAVASSLVWIVHFFATMRYTQWVAARIPSAKWLARARRLVWLLPTLVLGPLLIVILSGMFTAMSFTFTPAGGSPKPGTGTGTAVGLGVMLLTTCAWFICALTAAILYWNLLYSMRKEIRSLA